MAENFFKSVNCSTFNTVNSNSKTTVLRLTTNSGFRNTIVFDAFKINSVVFLSHQPEDIVQELKRCFDSSDTFEPSCEDDIDRSISELASNDDYFCTSIETEDDYNDFIQTLQSLDTFSNDTHIIVLLSLDKIDIEVLSNLICHTSSFIKKDGTSPMIHFITVGDKEKYNLDNIVDEPTESDEKYLQDLFIFQFIIDLESVSDNNVYNKKSLEDDYLNSHS